MKRQLTDSKKQDARDLLLGLLGRGFSKVFINRILKQLGKFKELLKDIVRLGERGLTAQDFDELLKRVEGIGPSILSGLLCHRFPDRYWIWNKMTENAAEELWEIGAWQSQPVEGTNGQRYFAWKPLQDEIRKALSENQLSSSYFDADMFCWWLSN